MFNYRNCRETSLDAIGTDQTTAGAGRLIIENQTAAAAGAQQYSPLLALSGQGYTAASAEIQFALQCCPVQGAAAPSADLCFLANVADGGFTTQAKLTSGGVLMAAALMYYVGSEDAEWEISQTDDTTNTLRAKAKGTGTGPTTPNVIAGWLLFYDPFANAERYIGYAV